MLGVAAAAAAGAALRRGMVAEGGGKSDSKGSRVGWGLREREVGTCDDFTKRSKGPRAAEPSTCIEGRNDTRLSPRRGRSESSRTGPGSGDGLSRIIGASRLPSKGLT